MQTTMIHLEEFSLWYTGKRCREVWGDANIEDTQQSRTLFVESTTFNGTDKTVRDK
jgi:hypothetical protein